MSMDIVGVIQIIAFIFKRFDDDNYIILCLYVDDMLVARSNMDHIKGFKEKLTHAFTMKYLGVVKQILGIKI